MKQAALFPGIRARQIASQGTLLFSGFALSQAMSFARNAMLGHWLSKGDFGVAATLTLVLQLIETLSDLGADRLIVQAADGDEPRFVATQHAALVLKGLLTAFLLLVAAVPAASFFGVPEAATAFAAIALVPAIKGFQHLDPRRAQRRLDNRPYLAVEIVPQAAALALTLPILLLVPDYRAAPMLSITQAMALVIVSHLFAERAYAIAADLSVARRLVAFGWPIWLSAFPLAAVYQGDRILIGHFAGMEALAGYTAAFMITMVPGLVAGKVGYALMLPLFAGARDDAAQFRSRYVALSEAVTTVAALYLVGFIVAGGPVLMLAFGSLYASLDHVVAWLALMWALRMLQAVPGMALMADGETRPFLAAGLIRSGALIPAAMAACLGGGLEMIAAMGVAGEIASLAYVARHIELRRRGLGAALALRALFLMPAAGVAALAAMTLATAAEGDAGLVIRAGLLAAVAVAVALLALAVMPRLRSWARDAMRKSVPA